MQYEQTDPKVSVVDQLRSEATGPVVMLSTYVVPPEQMESFLEVWSDLSRIMRRQPGNLGGQMHRAIGGASVYVNYALWETLDAFKAAFDNPEFWEAHKKMPAEPIGRQLLIEKIAIPGLCVA